MEKNYDFPILLEDEEIKEVEEGRASIVIRFDKEGNCQYYVDYD